ncbi:hypothetical protein [Calidithermus chliarophilus]|uniref:hypothetical protein n=1 Tax=Calidithermus chliarophilus TaxID=52023 RepID=UPI000411C676|nr:hypothetical protein [Calidithermus chliarophilus]
MHPPHRHPPLLEAAGRWLYLLPLVWVAPGLALAGALAPVLLEGGGPRLAPYGPLALPDGTAHGPAVPALAASILLGNALAGVAVPWLLARLAPFAPRLFVLLWALRVGWLATPAGLPDGGWYLTWCALLLVGEFAAYAQIADLASRGAPEGQLARRAGAALVLLALLAFYEAYVIARVL